MKLNQVSQKLPAETSPSFFKLKIMYNALGLIHLAATELILLHIIIIATSLAVDASISHICSFISKLMSQYEILATTLCTIDMKINRIISLGRI